MTLNTLKCNHLTSPGFKVLNKDGKRLVALSLDSILTQHSHATTQRTQRFTQPSRRQFLSTATSRTEHKL